MMMRVTVHDHILPKGLSAPLRLKGTKRQTGWWAFGTPSPFTHIYIYMIIYIYLYIIDLYTKLSKPVGLEIRTAKHLTTPR